MDVAMGQIPRSTERISSFIYFLSCIVLFCCTVCIIVCLAFNF